MTTPPWRKEKVVVYYSYYYYNYCVKVASGNGGMTVEAERQCAKDRKESKALVLSDHQTVLWLVSPREGWF